MAKADLHCHSKFSNHPEDWFLKRLGSSESYTQPEFVHEATKARGMDFVTITDHNRIEASLILKEQHPDKAFTGVESTVYFPENRAKVHILLWGFSEAQFKTVQEIRKDIYRFRDFVRDENIAYAVAHPAYTPDNRMTPEQLEKLLLMFDVFEGVNGSRTRSNNHDLVKGINSLTPDHIEDMRIRYGIEPISDEPWVKSFTGGTDDHAGLFLGCTYTEAPGATVDEFLESIRTKKSTFGGRTDDYKTYAFAIYKIAYDFSESRGGMLSKSLLPQISQWFLERSAAQADAEDPFAAAEALTKTHQHIQTLRALSANLKGVPDDNLDAKLNLAYGFIAELLDDVQAELTKSFEKDLVNLNPGKLIKHLSQAIPVVFLTAPFFGIFKHMHRERKLVDHVLTRFADGRPEGGKRILWFTDTLADLNGVAATLKTISRVADERQLNFRLAACVTDDEASEMDLPNLMRLPYVHDFPLPHYEKMSMKIPSLLRSMEMIEEYSPNEIFISTPGPVGLLAMLVARLLGVKTVGVFHTDVSRFADEITGDESLAEVAEAYMRWFFCSMDEIRVPTREYMDILESRGYDRAKMELFHRGIEAEVFTPRGDGRDFLRAKYDLSGGVNLLFAGRISKDKDLDILAEAYEEIVKRRGDVNLLIAGDGPYLDGLRARINGTGRVIYTGQIAREDLPQYYSGSDYFVFPSTSDTFGMVVLEAQACGLPAIVSDMGGPKEIIADGKTGFVTPGKDVGAWVEAIDKAIDLKERDPDNYESMRRASREHVIHNRDWANILESLL
ncbi:glycosyltransferase [bacterium]|nr:glycosyltransferase [bacterium]MCB9478018.1 glycosyltransferase [Deltaproteobacteria bacterium]